MLVWLGSVCGAMEGGMVWDCGSGMDTMREAGWMDGWMDAFFAFAGRRV